MKKLVVGRVSKLFGSQGELMVNLYEDFPRKAMPGSPVFTEIDGLEVPLFAGRFDPRGRASAVMLFDDMDTVRRASELLGKEIYIHDNKADKSSSVPDGMEGYAAILSDTLTGLITDVMDEGPNPLFEIELNGREILIPMADEFITRIDHKAKKIFFALPEGLLDLNE